MTGCGIAGGSSPRPAAPPWRRSRASRASTGSSMPGSMRPTSMSSPSATMAVTLGYTFVKRLLQTAGLLPKRRPRGRHRRRREPRPCFGELLHIDGSPHAWLALRPTERQTLIPIIDDATKRVLYAQLVAAESTATIMAALWSVLVDPRAAPGAVQRSRELGLLHAEGRAARRQGRAHAGRPRPGPPRHRAHPRLLARGPRPQRAPQPHLSGAPRQ